MSTQRDDKSPPSQEGAWLCLCDTFLHAQLWTSEKFHHVTLLTEMNNAVVGGPRFLAPLTVNASDAIH